jgi:uroporphyrin-III C-methyltransferase
LARISGKNFAGKSVNFVDQSAMVKYCLQNLPEIIPQLLTAGLAIDTPIILIRQGTCPDQQELLGNLGNILEKIYNTNFLPPAIAVIGNVVKFRDTLI